MDNAQTSARAIVSRPNILFGEPTVAGTRISVRTIVIAHYAFGGVKQVHEQLPILTVPDIEAALDYYRAHRDEINQHIAENNDGEDIPYDKLG
ncbi:MAG: DUF433 domain-containing protein [Chloroflexota bacterium]|nr:DUF433 domain-containing protein [Chloroflexota bacterium]MDQ6907358.1 DUF433 domain-containing protein [Chloroflexota bacterium]